VLPNGRFSGCIRCLTCYGIPGEIFAFGKVALPPLPARATAFREQFLPSAKSLSLHCLRYSLL
jgi:hypothetical protein